MTIGDEVRKALEAGPLIHFTTLNADGSPHTVVVWAGVDSDGEHVVIGKMNEDKKVRNLRRDPRVSLSLQAEGTTHGLANYLVIEGTAELVEGGGGNCCSDWPRCTWGRTPTSCPASSRPVTSSRSRRRRSAATALVRPDRRQAGESLVAAAVILTWPPASRP